MPTPGGADQQAVGFLLDEPECREVLDEPAVEGGLRVEVELLERLVSGELREPHPPVESALLGGFDLDGQQVVQEPGVAGLLLLGGLQRRCQRVGCGGELEVGEM